MSGAEQQKATDDCKSLREVNLQLLSASLMETTGLSRCVRVFLHEPLLQGTGNTARTWF